MSTPEVHGLVDPYAFARGAFEELVLLPNPAAGADATLKIIGDYDTRPLTAWARIVCDANVASREVVLQYLDGDSNVFATHGANTTITAGLTGDYFFSVQLATALFTVDSTALCPLTPLFLEAGWSIRYHVVSVQVGDQLSRLRLNLERFETGGRLEEGERYPRARRRRR